MRRMGWVVLLLVAVLFVSCSKEGSQGPAGPQGTAGSTGATGAAGIPRKMYIERTYVAENNVSGERQWWYTTTLPWTPATNGVIANFRGYFLSQWNGGDCRISTVTQNGTSVTVSGFISSELSPYNYAVYFDIIAYDTLATIMVNDKTPSNIAKLNKMPASVAKTTQP